MRSSFTTTTLQISPEQSGLGSSASGGELLVLATCYLNDVYHEVAALGVEVSTVEVECGAEFPSIGAPGQEISFSTRITALGDEAKVRELAARADRRAEVQNTVRAAVPVTLERVEIVGI